MNNSDRFKGPASFNVDETGYALLRQLDTRMTELERGLSVSKGSRKGDHDHPPEPEGMRTLLAGILRDQVVRANVEGRPLFPVQVTPNDSTVFGQAAIKLRDTLECRINDDSTEFYLSPYHHGALAPEGSRIYVMGKGECLYIGFDFPKCNDRLSIDADLLSRSLNIYLDLPEERMILGDHLRHHPWSRLDDQGDIHDTLGWARGDLGFSIVEDWIAEEGGTMPDARASLLRAPAGDTDIRAFLERSFLCIPLKWFDKMNRSTLGEQSAFWFCLKWLHAPEQAANQLRDKLLFNIVFYTDTVYEKLDNVNVNRKSRDIRIPRSDKMPKSQKVEILCLSDLQHKICYLDERYLLDGAMHSYRFESESKEQSQDLARVYFTREGYHDLLLFVAYSPLGAVLYPEVRQAVLIPSSESTSLAIHNKSAFSLPFTWRNLDHEGLWRRFVNLYRSQRRFITRYDFIGAIQTFSPYGLNNWVDAEHIEFVRRQGKIGPKLVPFTKVIVPLKEGSPYNGMDRAAMESDLEAHLNSRAGINIYLKVEISG